LASSAFDVGRFTLRLRPTNMQQVIDDSLQLVEPLFERRRQTFTLGEATTVAAHPEIQADPARLTLALVNLLTNASKYSPDGATIDLALSEQGEWLRIAVADRGPGVPLAAHSQLFNRFVRLDAPESEQASTGLGLFVVKATAEAHGGRVGIDDRPGGGAIFWLEIPRIAGTTNENSSRRGRPRVIRHSGFHVTPRRLRGRSRL
jgi:signal transduction histidine kinase